MFICLAAVNLAAFALYGIDKYKARRGLWRIPESVLLFAAAAGGSAGALLGMQVFHHKTKHVYFRVINLVCVILWTVLLVWLLFKRI